MSDNLNNADLKTEMRRQIKFEKGIAVQEMRRNGMTLADIAQKMGVGKDSVSRWESFASRWSPKKPKRDWLIV